MLYIILGVVGLGLVLSIILFFVFRRKGNKINFDYERFVNLLGGISNIEDASCKNSRLSVTLKDKNKVERDGLMEMGASALVVTSKKITLVLGVLSTEVCAYILKNKEW